MMAVVHSWLGVLGAYWALLSVGAAIGWILCACFVTGGSAADRGSRWRAGYEQGFKAGRRVKW